MASIIRACSTTIIAGLSTTTIAGLSTDDSVAFSTAQIVALTNHAGGGDLDAAITPWALTALRPSKRPTCVRSAPPRCVR